MKNHIQNGNILNFIAPSGGVTSGVLLIIGNLLVAPVTSADETKEFAGCVTGVVNHTKKTGEAWVQGETVYWDDTNSRFTKTSATGLFKAGVAAAAAASDAVLADVRLDGVGVTAEA